jgi:hypothetical protein
MGSRGRQRLGRLRVVAGFQVSIDGRFWVSTEGASGSKWFVMNNLWLAERVGFELTVALWIEELTGILMPGVP